MPDSSQPNIVTINSTINQLSVVVRLAIGPLSNGPLPVDAESAGKTNEKLDEANTLSFLTI